MEETGMSEKFLRYSCGVAALAAVGWAGSSADAVVVTITAGTGAGTTVFDSGGFESPPYVATTTPSASDPTVGTWVLGSTASDGVKALTGPTLLNQNGVAAAGPAGAYQLLNYLTVDRSQDSAGANTFIAGSFTQDIVLADSSFQVEFALWGTDGLYALFGVGSDAMGRVGTTEDESSVQLAFDDRGSSAVINPLGNTVASLGTFNVNVWNEVVYTWDHVNSQNILTVNGNDYVIAAPTTSANTTAGEFVFGLGLNDPAVFIDAVPEPGSMALVSLGGLLILKRRKASA
jgi:hypothetical protein